MRLIFVPRILPGAHFPPQVTDVITQATTVAVPTTVFKTWLSTKVIDNTKTVVQVRSFG